MGTGIPSEILEKIKQLTPSVLATSRDGKPYTTFITWLSAVDNKTVRFALSSDSYSAENLRQNPYASVEVIGEGFAVSISGPVKEVVQKIEELDFGVSVFELSVENVVDNLFPGGSVKGKIPFEHTGDVEKARELDSIVYRYLSQ
ncbi:pyridoxamine 5'-phosphate oxidase family protein [Persephonella sp.]|nr:pyridoxamine 5'-phosphate oxidase [Aquificota bacterium]